MRRNARASRRKNRSVSPSSRSRHNQVSTRRFPPRPTRYMRDRVHHRRSPITRPVTPIRPPSSHDSARTPRNLMRRHQIGHLRLLMTHQTIHKISLRHPQRHYQFSRRLLIRPITRATSHLHSNRTQYRHIPRQEGRRPMPTTHMPNTRHTPNRTTPSTRTTLPSLRYDSRAHTINARMNHPIDRRIMRPHTSSTNKRHPRHSIYSLTLATTTDLPSLIHSMRNSRSPRRSRRNMHPSQSQASLPGPLQEQKCMHQSRYYKLIVTSLGTYSLTGTSFFDSLPLA